MHKVALVINESENKFASKENNILKDLTNDASKLDLWYVDVEEVVDVFDIVQKLGGKKMSPHYLFRKYFNGQLPEGKIHIIIQPLLPTTEPKSYGKDYWGRLFLIMEQIIEIWNMLASDSGRSIKRVLSGPMGVGKSYLILFLAAKAFA
ncbi:hypothetical protein RhiirA5_430293 [Rhizophagus irregularis]|uniref:Uncharacterized protein n=1 Tax=Rhizophagus irregularis TaxID=588596 RepID=A0A2N0NWZ4_9GLOM|nr:hypothetical protein RhiirA5_430293 [Rhizophagus irregularis]